MAHTIIIVDDHKMFLDGLLSIIQPEKEYTVALATTDAHHVMKYLAINAAQQIDLIITDISMPSMDGLDFIQLLKKEHKEAKVLVISMNQDHEMVQSALDLGVRGYVSKNAPKHELFTAIETIIGGESYFSADIKRSIQELSEQQKQQKKIKLTEREIEVISLIAQEYTTQEIADTLFLSKYTIEGYRKNLIAKLNVRNLAGITKYALKMKYIKS